MGKGRELTLLCYTERYAKAAMSSLYSPTIKIFRCVIKKYLLTERIILCFTKVQLYILSLVYNLVA